MDKEDIKQMNKVAESCRKNAKVMDRLINKLRRQKCQNEGSQGGQNE